MCFVSVNYSNNKLLKSSFLECVKLMYIVNSTLTNLHGYSKYQFILSLKIKTVYLSKSKTLKKTTEHKNNRYGLIELNDGNHLIK